MSEQKQRAHNKDTEDEPQVEPKDLSTDTDVTDILDEIDAVLEREEETFVRDFIQKGGE